LEVNNMPNISPIPPSKSSDGIIKTLEGLLDEARNGKITAIGYVILTPPKPDGSRGDYGLAYNAGVSLISLIGLLAFLERMLMEEQDHATEQATNT
jgi:hypothetical protein